MSSDFELSGHVFIFSNVAKWAIKRLPKQVNHLRRMLSEEILEVAKEEDGLVNLSDQFRAVSFRVLPEDQ